MNEDLWGLGKTMLEGVPAIMNALETLTEIHPFLKGTDFPFSMIHTALYVLPAAYFPFKLIYHQ